MYKALFYRSEPDRQVCHPEELTSESGADRIDEQSDTRRWFLQHRISTVIGVKSTREHWQK